ncbi:chemotaxis protein CheW [Ekhidna sp.]|uniref:chemotaxis protein CheW n=1 Tax=Ekhidna sp. TaxID=2608089 RepID=UPI003516F91A
MALGKNLKKQQLISSEKKEVKATKKKVEKKKLIKAKPKKRTTKQDLINYISEKELERKKNLRERYKREIAAFSDQQMQLVVFKIEKEEFAIDISKVKEIVVVPEFSEAPDSSPHVKGIASVRGKTLVAIDLALKMKKPETKAQFLLTINSEQPIGILLENLPVTLKVSGNSISSDLSMLDQTSRDITYIKGLVKLEKRIIFYLDIRELVESDNAIVVPDEFIK